MEFFYHESGVKLPGKVAVMAVRGSILMPRAYLNVPMSEDLFLKITAINNEDELFVGVVQPILEKYSRKTENFSIFSTGTLGRITDVSESHEGSVFVNVNGICRFDIEKEFDEGEPGYIAVNYERYAGDLSEASDFKIDRDKLFKALKSYFGRYESAPDWEEIDKTSDENLITVLSMVCPFHEREKQALLETSNVGARSEMLTKFIEFAKFDGIVSSAVRH